MNPQTPPSNTETPDGEPNTVIQPDSPAQSGPAPQPNPPTQPIPAWQQPNNKPAGSSAGSSKKLLLIVLAAVVIIVLLVVIVMAVTKHKSNKANNSDTSTESDLYHSRPGYDIKEYGSSIGDPQALSMSKLDKATNTSKGPLVYACNVVTMNDLNTLKTYMSARSDPQAIQRTFVDNIGQKTPQFNQYTLPATGDDNVCMYSLETGGLLHVHVYQAAFVDPGATQHTLDRHYTKVSDVAGLATYKEKDGSSSTSDYIVVSGNDSIEVLFNGTKVPADKQQEILALAAKNFADQQKTAKGPAIPTYDTPTYKKKWVRACDLISNADIKNLTGSDASIYTTEGLASGTGVYKVGETLYNGITTSCDRYNTDIGSGIGAGPFDQELEVRVASFNSDVPAKAYVAAAAKDNTSGQVKINIGDEGVAFPDNAGQNTLVFRQGRFTVDIVYDRTLQKKANLSDVNAMVQKLTPYAQSVASKLKSLQ